ncbi:hypothetical protein FGB62_68g171 [Gracilaria domingensis]|nr:hypothetical protein FGB62_68g171 [Gracilaria domingensis]
MDDWFKEALAAYRTQSSANFYRIQQTKLNVSEPKLAPSPPDTSRQAFERVIFPALGDHLARAAKTYKEWKHRKSVAQSARVRSQRLGTGEPVKALFASLRRERWLLHLAKQAHFIRAPVPLAVVQITICGIPEDLRRAAHQRYMTYKSTLVQRLDEKRASSSWAVIGVLEGDEEWTLYSAFLTTDESYLAHVSRCRVLYSEGKRILVRVNKTVLGESLDDFEEVRKRYLGKPDELYRRKTARKFARWRRQQREKEKQKVAAEIRAEKEMKRRRGYDHRLTMREARDATFAPFLFDTSCNAYAYSSKITEAPKLRKIMMTKYSDTRKSSDGQQDQWERARQAAETNPLFHTRVMNRFA